jgi:GntR family transcriptional regulator
MADLLDDGSARLRFDNLSVLATTAPPGLAGRLDIPVGAEVVFLERLMLLDGRPLTLRSSWIPAALGSPILEGAVDLRQSIFNLLKHGLGFDRGVTEYSIEAALADEAVAAVMKVPIGSALVLCESLTRLVDGRPVQYGYARSPADRVRFVTTVGPQPDLA